MVSVFIQRGCDVVVKVANDGGFPPFGGWGKIMSDGEDMAKMGENKMSLYIV